MTKEEMLQEQIDMMDKLLKLKQAVIDELEAKIVRLEMAPATIGAPWPGFPWPNPAPGLVNIPSVFGPVDVCPSNPSGLHDYPNPWNGTQPPCCKACGKPAWSSSSGTILGGIGSTLAGSQNAGLSAVQQPANGNANSLIDALKNSGSV